MKIAFMGVHGVGKTTLCREISRVLGVPCVEVETDEFLKKAFSVGKGFERQRLFMEWYLKQYREVPRSCVLDAHPLNVIAYTDYFLGGRAVDWFVERLRASDGSCRVDLLVLLEPPSIGSLVSRLRKRPEWRQSDEIDFGYLEGVIDRCRYWFKRLGGIVAFRKTRLVAVDGVDNAVSGVLHVLRTVGFLGETVL